METPETPGMEYKQRGKFLNVLMPASGVKILKTQYVQKPVLEVQNPKYPMVAEATLLIVGNEKVGMLADYLGINRNQLRSNIKKDNVAATTWLNSELKNAGDRKIKIDASEYGGKFYVFTVATEVHTTVTFGAIRATIHEVLGKTDLGETNAPGSGMKWVKRYPAEDVGFDTLAAEVVVLSGGNTLKDSIKVSTRVQVSSCKNSMVCGDFSRVKHTENWNQRLRNILESASDIAAKAIEVVRFGANVDITLEEGLRYIEEMELPITTSEKCVKVKDALKLRFAYEFKRGNAWELSQALSYYGSHGNVEDSSEHTLEVCSVAAYQVLRGVNK
jgi:hypothetical protein